MRELMTFFTTAIHDFRENCIINETELFDNPHTNYVLYLYKYQIYPAEFGPNHAKTWSIYRPDEFKQQLLSQLIYKQLVWDTLCTFNDYLQSNRYFISSVSWKTFINRCSPAGCGMNKTLSLSEAIGALVDCITYPLIFFILMPMTLINLYIIYKAAFPAEDHRWSLIFHILNISCDLAGMFFIAVSSQAGGYCRSSQISTQSQTVRKLLVTVKLNKQ